MPRSAFFGRKKEPLVGELDGYDKDGEGVHLAVTFKINLFLKTCPIFRRNKFISQ